MQSDEDRSDQDRREEGDMFWDNAYGNPRIHEEPCEPSKKGAISKAMGHTRLQGRTRRERTLEASRNRILTSRIRTSGVPGGHPGHDSRRRGKRRNQDEQENSTEENRIG